VLTLRWCACTSNSLICFGVDGGLAAQPGTGGALGYGDLQNVGDTETPGMYATLNSVLYMCRCVHVFKPHHSQLSAVYVSSYVHTACC
jgi:hypothetical protein